MKKGDKFKVINDTIGFDVGTIVTFTRYEEEDYTMAWFTGTTKFNDVEEWPVLLTKVVPYVEEKELNGDGLYVVIGKSEPYHYFDLGDVVEFTGEVSDEGNPGFRRISGGMRQWMHWQDVRPYNEKGEDFHPVDKPKHYNLGKVECIDAIEAALTPEEFVGYLKGNQLKYIWRMGKKGDAAQDLDKSMWYGRKLMETINEI